MARNPALWIRVPNGGTPDNPAVYTAIRDSLREISEAVRLLQGGTAATVASTTAASGTSSPYTNSGPNIYLPLAGGTMTGLLTTVASASGSAGFRLPHGAAPTTPTNGDMWTTTAGLYARINGTTVGPFSAAVGVYLPLAGGTMTGLLTTVASASGGAGLNLPHGAAPTTPVNGDLWTTTAGVYARINGATVGPFSATTGTVTSVTGTSPVASSGGTTPAISLNAAYGDTLNPYGSKTANYVLAAPNGSAGVPSFRALVAADIPNLDASKITTGQVAIARGGTGQSTATAAFDALAPTTTLGDTIYYDGADNVRLAGNTTTTKLVLTQTGTGVASAAPTWGQLAASDIITGQALTKVDDTNVLLTLGGTPGSALLKAVSLTLSWSGTLAQTRGGFGADVSSVLQNRVYASPNGSAGAPTFRALVAADIPSLSGTYLPLAGGTMAGTINMSSNLVSNASAVGIGGAASTSYPLYVTQAVTNTSGFADLSVLQYQANPAAPSTAEYTSVYANTVLNSGTITGRGRVVWAEMQVTAATVSNATAVYGNILLTSTGNLTNATALHAAAPSASSTGRITGYAAGVYIEAQTGGAVTGTAYGVYQASTSDKNIFAGNTRIGSTTTATNALDVTGAATVSGNLTVDTSTFAVDATNNRVGIGTSAPGQALDINFGAVVGNLVSAITNTDTTASSDSRFVMYNSATNGGLIMRSTGHATEPSDLVMYSAANNLRFYTNATLRAAITSGGNFFVDTNVLFVDAASNEVGINTATPAAALDVSGAALVSGNFTVDTTTFHVDSTNNRIGVGTTTPSTLAHFFQSTTGDAQVRLNNNNAGTAAVMTYLLTNGSANAGLELTGASYTTYPSRLKLYNGAAGGVVMESDNASGFFAVSVGATFPTGERMRVKGNVTTLTNNTNTSVISLGLSAGSFAGATIVYTIEATDGTNHQCASGIVHVAIARNAAGTYATGQVSNTVTTSSATSGTLAITWAAPTGADPSLIQVNANSSLAVSAGYPRIRYTVFRNGSGTINIL